jgi:hypothetical protein
METKPPEMPNSGEMIYDIAVNQVIDDNDKKRISQEPEEIE